MQPFERSRKAALNPRRKFLDMNPYTSGLQQLFMYDSKWLFLPVLRGTSLYSTVYMVHIYGSQQFIRLRNQTVQVSKVRKTYKAIRMCFMGPVRAPGKSSKLINTLSIRYGDQQTANRTTTATSILTTLFSV